MTSSSTWEYLAEGYSVKIQYCEYPACDEYLGVNYPSDYCDRHRGADYQNSLHAQAALEAAKIFLGWKLDQLKLYVGMVEVVTDPDDLSGDQRFVPLRTDEHGQTWGAFVRERS